MEQKKLLVTYNNKEALKLAKEFIILRKNTVLVQEKSTYKEDIIRVAKKRQAPLYISFNCSKITRILLGRLYGDQELDSMTLELNQFKSYKEFKTLPPELNFTFITVFKNLELRQKNLFLDLFSFQRKEICLEYLNYNLFLEKINDIINISLFRKNIIIGPHFSFVIKDEEYCEDELFCEAINRKENKTEKNVTKSVYDDKVGRLHLEKENVTEIRFKRNRAYREFNKK